MYMPRSFIQGEDYSGVLVLEIENKRNAHLGIRGRIEPVKGIYCQFYIWLSASQTDTSAVWWCVCKKCAPECTKSKHRRKTARPIKASYFLTYWTHLQQIPGPNSIESSTLKWKNAKNPPDMKRPRVNSAAAPFTGVLWWRQKLRDATGAQQPTG